MFFKQTIVSPAPEGSKSCIRFAFGALLPLGTLTLQWVLPIFHLAPTLKVQTYNHPSTGATGDQPATLIPGITPVRLPSAARLHHTCSSGAYNYIPGRWKYDIVAGVLSAPLSVLELYWFACFVLARGHFQFSARDCLIATADPNCVGGVLWRAYHVPWLPAGRVRCARVLPKRSKYVSCEMGQLSGRCRIRRGECRVCCARVLPKYSKYVSCELDQLSGRYRVRRGE